MKIEKQIKGFIRLNDNIVVELNKCKVKYIKSKNGKISNSYVYNDEIITKYKWKYIIVCGCGKETKIRKDHYNEYYKSNKEYLCSSCQQKGKRNKFWSSENPINWTAKIENKNKIIENGHKISKTRLSFSKDKLDEIYNKTFTPEARKNMSNSMKNKLLNYKLYEPEKYKKWMSNLNNNAPVIKSKAHKIVEKQLTLLGIKFESEYMLSGHRKYKYDIFIPNINLLIEINGDKVHANPKKYNENDIISDKWGTIYVKDRWAYDKEKKIYAEDRKYNTLTIWSSDIFRKFFNIIDWI